MHRSTNDRITSLLVFFSFFSISLFSQTISYETPDEFFVCGAAPFDVTVTNNSATAIQNVTLEVNFTTNNGMDCGLAYLPGSVLNASESNISDLGAPIFALADLGVGEAVTVTFQVEAPCSVVDCIDGAEFFVNDIHLNWLGGNTSTTTNPYVIERALLVITEVNSSFMSGSQGDLLTREITIVNTRPGALQGFTFTDTHQGGISITGMPGTDISPGGNIFQLAIDGSDFTTIGDGDDLFELNESITITEFIRITDCGVEVPSTVSDIVVGWGCGGEICQEVSKNAIITISLSKKEPNLIWEPITNFAECFCGPDGFQQGMKISNVGSGGAENLFFHLNRLTAVRGGIDVTSIVVDSVGTLLDVTPGTTGMFSLTSPCTGTDNDLVSTFTLTIPFLGPSQVVTIFWDVYFCDVHCNQTEVDWEYRWSYFKECPPSPYVEQSEFIYVHDGGVFMNSIAGVNSGLIVQNGDTVEIVYELTYDSLTLLGDELALEITLPCGASWVDSNALILNGQAPLNITETIDTASTTFTAFYQLPFQENLTNTSFAIVFSCEDLCFEQDVCQDSLISSCTLVPCATPPPPGLGIDIRTTVNKCTDFPLGCNLQTCTSATFTYECEIDSVCLNEPPGYAIFDFAASRSNYGLPDNDDDRLPDGTGMVDLSLVRTDRLIAGDTIQAYLGGEVVIDSAGVTLPFGEIRMSFFGGAMTNFNAAAMIKDGSGISEEEVLIRIFDSSSNSYFDCNDPDVAIMEVFNLLEYSYDISAAALGSCVSAGFEFDEGDSIIFEGKYKLRYNLLREIDFTPMSGFITLRPDIFVFDADTSRYEPISCSCTSHAFEVSAYEYVVLPGIFGLPLCDSSQFIGGSLLRLELAENNFFPFEHRNLIFAEDWQMAMPDEITLNSAKMTFLRYQNSNVILNNEPLDWTFANNNYVFDIGQYQNPSIDEGYSILFQYIFKTECDVSGARPLTITSNFDFLNSMPEEEDPLELVVDANALQALTPKLQLQAFFFDITSFNNQLVLDFFLGNEPTTVAAQSSGDAPNTWLYITSQSGLVTDFQLVDPATGNVFTPVNGVYQLGSFPIDTVAFQLLATNNSCETETFTIHYGWNCDPFTSQVQTSCYRRSQDFTLTSPPGEIDFLLNSPSGCFDLCETIPPYSLEIFNGGLGAVYELIAQAQMPQGQVIIPGSSQVEYPSGSGNFFPIDDPTNITSTLVEWDLSAFDSLANGLSGVGSAPANSITLFFETMSECGFIADAFTLFTIAAEQNCGIPSNSVAKPGDPVCINGVSTPYSTNIDVETETPFGCADEMIFEFSMTASQTLPLGACAIVTLPQGISLVPNSCSSACQGNFNCTPTIDGNTYTWQLPQGVPSNQIVCFSFNTSGWSGLGCEEGIVIFRTANETQALCAATGEMCSTKVSTGSLLFPYNIQRPEYELDNFTINASQTGGDDLADFSIDIINCGPQNEPPITVDFYLDTDNDGSGDQLVHSENEVAIISNCQSVTMTGSFSLSPDNLCNLVAYINPNQCLCSLDSAYILSPITYQTDQSYVVCSGEDRTIGVTAMTGFTYQWEPADCLGNENDATTIFSCVNDTPVPVTYQFTLSETDGASCEINNLLDVTVQPVPGVAFAETPICAGEQSNIFATDGVTYQWEGPNISDPTVQVQTIAPATSSTYSVTVTDAFNCMGTDMVTIEVNALPQVDAGDDIFICPGIMPQLNATFDPNWEYLWSPAVINGQPALSDPTAHNPDVITAEDAIFTLVVTDGNGCTGSDVVFVSQSGALNLVVSPDITICLGTETTLTVSGGDTYVWTPQGDCNDPTACDSLTVMPTDTTTYTVVASTSDGCLDSAMVTIATTSDTIFTFETKSICAGESVVIHDTLRTESGEYVEVFPTTQGDCDSVSTVTLIVGDPSEMILVDSFFCEGGSVEVNGLVYDQPGMFMDTILAADGCDSILYMIDLEEIMLDVEIMGKDTIAPGDSVLLEIDPTGFDSVVWSGGDMGAACVNMDNCLDTIVENATTYYVTVLDENGCEATDSHEVEVLLLCFPDEARVPNVFTPNGDEYNETFNIVGPNSEQVLMMRIWDRWGTKVYEGAEPWDGTYDGKPAASDVYIYHIEIGCPVGVEAEEAIRKGDVTLLR